MQRFKFGDQVKVLSTNRQTWILAVMKNGKGEYLYKYGDKYKPRTWGFATENQLEKWDPIAS